MILGQAQPFASPEEALQHFGVKGMRWGVRKEEPTLSQKVSAQAIFSGGGMGHGNPNFELHDPSSLSVSITKGGYADIRPIGGFVNPQVKARHDEMIATIDEMRTKYPSVKNMNIEVVPMSRVPGQESNVNGSFASVQHIKSGEARVIYNDVLGKLEPHQANFVKQWMPGVGTKNYLGYHEMGHLLAVSHGTMPPTFEAVNRGRSKDYNKYYKANQKAHEKLLKRHGLSFQELSKLSGYSATEPSEALAELHGHYQSPVMRKRLDADTTRKAKLLFDELGGVT